MKGVAGCSASSRREWLVVLQALEGSGWLNGLAAFEGGATAFGQAFHSHKPSQRSSFVVHGCQECSSLGF